MYQILLFFFERDPVQRKLNGEGCREGPKCIRGRGTTKANNKKRFGVRQKEKINSRIFKVCGIEDPDDMTSEQLKDLNAKIDATIKSRKEEF